MTDIPRDEVTLTESSSVGVSGSASDETRELSRLHAAYEALLHTPEAEGYQAWSLAQKLLTLAMRYDASLEVSEVRVAGLSADVSRLTERIQSMHEALRKESVRSELAFRERDEERARVAVLREALEAVVDFEPGSMRDFNAVGAIRQIAADALEASLRDAGEAGA